MPKSTTAAMMQLEPWHPFSLAAAKDISDDVGFTGFQAFGLDVVFSFGSATCKAYTV